MRWKRVACLSLVLLTLEGWDDLAEAKLWKKQNFARSAVVQKVQKPKTKTRLFPSGICAFLLKYRVRPLDSQDDATFRAAAFQEIYFNRNCR